MPAPKFDRFKKYLGKHKPSIQEIVREPTSGGIVFRHGKTGDLEILLIQDAKEQEKNEILLEKNRLLKKRLVVLLQILLY